VKATSTTAVRVEAGGTGVVGHVGLHALGRFADRLGLPDALSSAVSRRSHVPPVHDRGKVLVQAMLMLAGGGECCSDIEQLREEEALFGPVPSDTTFYRMMTDEIGEKTLVGLKKEMASVRRRVFDHAEATSGSTPVVLDIDATLVTVHSENKEGAAPNYKGGFGYHPMLCFADATGEALSGMLRPGNAGANNAKDHLQVLDEATAQLPKNVAVGHHDGDDPRAVRRKVAVRADSAGATKEFLEGCRRRNVTFSVVARSNREITTAIGAIYSDKKRWKPARRQDGTLRKGAAVAEITDLVDLSGFPAGTRLIVRREPLHPGAQQTLFHCPTYRFWGHYTDEKGKPVKRDLYMRAHAHCEDHIERLQNAGLLRMPFKSFEANKAWFALVCFGADLVRWFQLLVTDGSLRAAEPKTLRWYLWHVPARLVYSGRRVTVRILDGCPAADDLLEAHRRIAMLT
jgi:Transposase DDE domain group 1